MLFQKQCDDRRNVGTCEAVTRKTSVPAARPGCANVHAGSRKFDHLAISEAEPERVRFVAFDNRDQRRLKDRREAGLWQIVGGRHDHAARKICPIQQIVQRRKKLRLGRAKAKVYHPILVLDGIFQTRKK